MNFIHAFIARLMGGLVVTVPTTRPTQGGYYEGDDSPWIMTDNGPINTQGR